MIPVVVVVVVVVGVGAETTFKPVYGLWIIRRKKPCMVSCCCWGITFIHGSPKTPCMVQKIKSETHVFSVFYF